MTTVEIKSQMPLEALLDSLNQLGADELYEVAFTAVRLRASRHANTIPEAEATLLQRINTTMPPDTQKRLALLIEKRQDETLTESELEELIALGDRIEEIQVERLSALIQLAAIRNVPLESLKQTLNLPE